MELWIIIILYVAITFFVMLCFMISHEYDIRKGSPFGFFLDDLYSGRFFSIVFAFAFTSFKFWFAIHIMLAVLMSIIVGAIILLLIVIGTVVE